MISPSTAAIPGATYEGDMEPERQKDTYFNSPKKRILVPGDPIPPTEDDKKITEKKSLTTKDRVKNTLIGAGLGAAVGDAIVATAGAAGSIIAGSASTYISFFGATGLQTFAQGAVIYDIFAMVFSALFGVEMEPIEIEP